MAKNPKRFHLCDIDPGDKDLVIYDADAAIELRMDYDDVDQKKVLRVAKSIVRALNSAEAKLWLKA